MINKKALSTDPNPKDSSEEVDAIINGERIAKNPLRKLFDMIDKQNDEQSNTSQKIQQQVNDQTNQQDDDLDDVDLDDDLDEYINFDAQQNTVIQKEENEMDQQLNSLVQSLSKSVDEVENEEVQVPEILKAELRDYQKQALGWMLNREKKGRDQSQPKLHPLYVEKKFQDGTKFYFNQFTGMMTLKFVNAPPDPRGGILADEMGLGKTIVCI